MRVILNYGLGVDSSVIAHRWLTDPTSRNFELSDLTVLTAMTGDEFESTKWHVETFMLPLFRDKGVRYVQVARNGPTREEGISVLSDTTCPTVLHTEGVWALSDELLAAGTVPQVASRRCSEKFKGWTNDTWLEQEMNGEPFRQAMGFNADEAKRVDRDACYGGDNRNSEYPLMAWGMGREACEQYLRQAFGVDWPKSCCVFCPFAKGKEHILARYRESPEEAAEALFIEHVSLSLNPRMPLYADKSLAGCIDKDENREAQRLLEAKLAASEWALYQVRRVFKRKGSADRAITVVGRGSRLEMMLALETRFDDRQVKQDLSGGIVRYITVPRVPDLYPCAEEMWVAAPAVVKEKQPKKFEETWERVNALVPA